MHLARANVDTPSVTHYFDLAEPGSNVARDRLPCGCNVRGLEAPEPYPAALYGIAHNCNKAVSKQGLGAALDFCRLDSRTLLTAGLYD
jgi:hypothetical protein